MQESRPRRRNKLPKPPLQLRLILAFLGVMSLTLLLQLLLLARYLTELAAEMPLGGDELRRQAPAMLMEILAYSFGLLIPATIGIGVLITFRTAGPIYRFEKYLNQVVRGEEVGPCSIRERDELQELCDSINAALESTKRRAQETASAEDPRGLGKVA